MYGWADGRGQYHHSSGTATQTGKSSRVREREKKQNSEEKKRKRQQGVEEELLWDTLYHCEMKDLDGARN